MFPESRDSSLVNRPAPLSSGCEFTSSSHDATKDLDRGEIETLTSACSKVLKPQNRKRLRLGVSGESESKTEVRGPYLAVYQTHRICQSKPCPFGKGAYQVMGFYFTPCLDAMKRI